MRELECSFDAEEIFSFKQPMCTIDHFVDYFYIESHILHVFAPLGSSVGILKAHYSY